MRTAPAALRALLLLGMVLALPATTGWITVYVLGGIVVVLTMGCCCCGCCCDPCGDPCSGCGCDCAGCDPCAGCCDDCGDPCADCDCDPGCDDCAGCGDCGDCGCGDCGGDCTCATGTDLDVAAQAAPLVLPWLGALPPHWLAHHPDTPAYDADVYPVAGRRFCIGCFTTFPLFLIAAGLLTWLTPGGPWSAWLASGIGLAAMQGVSAAGLARRRWQKVLVKTCLGAGMALAVYGALRAPGGWLVQAGILLGLLALAGASAVPRARRMAAASRCQASK